jgi:cell growth-regulating nucleolar protein
LKDVRKKAIELIEKHPKYKKSDKSDLKKKFEKEFNLTLKDGAIVFA